MDKDVQSSAQLLQKVPDACFIPYESIRYLRSLEDILPKAIILYQLNVVGHFCAIFRNSEGINFFDPLGMIPDDELRYVKPQFRHLNQNYTYLINLLLACKEPIIYNQYRLQKLGTSTCGPWCVVRLIYSHLKCDEFAKCFKGIKNKDKAVMTIYKNICTKYRFK